MRGHGRGHVRCTLVALVGLAGCAASLWTSSTEPGPGDPGALEDVVAAVPPASIELERACDGGDASACARVAELFWDGRNGHTHDPARSFRHARRGCDGGDAHACALLARHHEEGLGAEWAPHLAVEAYDRACSAGSGFGCHRLGLMYRHGRGVDVDRRKVGVYFARASEHLLAACERGELRWCADASRAILREEEAGAEERARQLDQRGCDGGIASSCLRMLVVHRERQPGHEDAGVDPSELDRLCRAGESDACRHLATVLDGHTASSERRDPARAASLVKQACVLGDGFACLDAGLRIALARPARRGLRIPYYRRACDRAAAEGCMYLAVELLTSRDRSRRPEGRELARRGCERGSSTSCDILARIHVARTESAPALRWYTEGCRRGSVAACTYLVQNDFALPSGLSQLAAQLHERVCKEKNQPACKRLEKLREAERATVQAVLDAMTRRDGERFTALAASQVDVEGLWFGSPDCAAQFSGARSLRPAQHPAFLECLASHQPRVVHHPAPERAELVYDPGVSLSLEISDGTLWRITGPIAGSHDREAAPLGFPALLSHRVSGVYRIALDPAVRAAIASSPGAVAFVRLLACVDPSGKLEPLTVLQRSTGHDAYVQAIERTIREWRFKPFVVHGEAVRACAVELFAHPPERADQVPSLPPSPRSLAGTTPSRGRAPPDVPPTALDARRIAGEMNIVPDVDSRRAITASGHDRVVGSFKLCLTARGDVATIETLLSTGFPGYDRGIKHDMYRWKYRPFTVDAVPTPVCTAVTFIYSQR